MSKYPGRIVTDLAPAGYSVYFDGSGDRIQTASSAALALGTNDFSIEWWERRDAIGSDDTPVSTGDYSSAYASCLLGYSGTAGYISTNGASWNVLNGPAYVDPVLPNVWNHFVYTRSGTAFRVFMNGKLSNYVTGSGSVVQNNNRFNVGGNSGGAQYDFPGYISNFRVVIGSIPTQYQTSSTTVGTQIFTPPTQLFPVTNTVLLACNSPSIIDQSSNNIAFTVTGNAAVSTVTPFTAYVPYNPTLGAATPGVWTLDEATQAQQTRRWNMYDPHFNLTTLLLRSGSVDGSQNNQFLDSSSNNFTITRNPTSGPNAPTQGTFSPFSQAPGYWSNYFDGSGDSFSVSTSTVLDLNGAIDFTIEAWVYLTGYGSTSDMSLNIANKFTGAGGLGYTYGIFGGGANQGKIQFYGAAGSVSIISTNVIPLNSWNHVAIVKSGTTYTHYLNGVANGSQTTATTLTASANALVIGDYGYSDDFLGYMSNLRITKNGAVYTSGFTPPTSPLTTSVSAGTVSLLTFQSNRFVDNSSNGFTLTPSGTPSAQAFSPFYSTVAYTPQTIGGGGSFDGTGDNLTVAGNAAFAFGTGDFTLEAWIYPNSISTGTFDRVCATSDFNGVGFDWTLNTGSSSLFLASSSYGFSINTRSWNHIVYTRSGTTLRGFLNGRLASYNTGVSQNISSTTSLLIGQGYSGTNFNGFMTDLRIIKGSIPTSYQTSATTTGTQVFTPPTAPLTTTSQGATSGNVSLLLNYANAAITDATGKNVLETVGNAQASTSVRNTRLVTTPPTSMYFDGTGDYLVTPSSPVNILGSGDFTVEFWAYPSNTSTAYRALVASENYAGTTGGWSIYQNGTSIEVWLTAGQVINATSALTATTWQHVALSRASGTVRLFVNGTSIASASNTAEWTGQRIFIGDNNYAGIDYFYNGYLDDLRITKGFARYTGPFTPPRSRLQEQ